MNQPTCEARCVCDKNSIPSATGTWGSSPYRRLSHRSASQSISSSPLGLKKNMRGGPKKNQFKAADLITMFKYKCELPLGVKNIVKSDNVRVLQLLEQTDLPQSRTRHPFIVVVKANPFECNNLPTFSVLRLEDCAISALSNLFKFLILLHLGSLVEKRKRDQGQFQEECDNVCRQQRSLCWVGLSQFNSDTIWFNHFCSDFISTTGFWHDSLPDPRQAPLLKISAGKKCIISCLFLTTRKGPFEDDLRWHLEILQYCNTWKYCSTRLIPCTRTTPPLHVNAACINQSSKV